jgi:hypothetical protein
VSATTSWRRYVNVLVPRNKVFRTHTRPLYQTSPFPEHTPPQGKDEAEEAVSRSFAKKKALASEKKMAKTQKDEADKHLSKEAELEAQQRDLALFKLYHVDQQVRLC